MTRLIAVSLNDLPADPDLKMVFAAKTDPHCVGNMYTYLLRTDLIGQDDAGAVALLGWMNREHVDLIYG